MAPHFSGTRIGWGWGANNRRSASSPSSVAPDVRGANLLPEDVSGPRPSLAIGHHDRKISTCPDESGAHVCRFEPFQLVLYSARLVINAINWRHHVVRIIRHDHLGQHESPPVESTHSRRLAELLRGSLEPAFEEDRPCHRRPSDAQPALQRRDRTARRAKDPQALRLEGRRPAVARGHIRASVRSHRSQPSSRALWIWRLRRDQQHRTGNRLPVEPSHS